MKLILSFLVSVFFCFTAAGQHIVYSQPDNNDSRNMNFDIIGKINGNYLVYKEIRKRSSISVYDGEMVETERVPLQFLDDEKVLDVNFIAFPDFAWMIYQFQRKDIIYLNAVKIGGAGKLLDDPIELDTSAVRFMADKKIYTVINSEDKNRVMTFKIQKEEGFFTFTTLLFDKEFNLQHKSRIETIYQDKKYIFSDFLLSNSGNLVFTVGDRSSNRTFISELSIVTKAPAVDTFQTTSIGLNDKIIDEIKLKVDNMNSHYILNSFYYLKKKGNTEGIFTAVVDEGSDRIISRTFASVGDDLRENLRAKGNKKSALNDFFIRNVILKNDGGFLLMAEDFYNESRYSPWNRWDYLYGGGYSPFYSPYYYYSPYYSPFYWGNRGLYDYRDVRYYYNNILVLSLDSTGKYDWTRVVNKAQFDDQTDNSLSYALMISGGKLRFLFNEVTRRKQILNERTIDGDGEIQRSPPMHNLDKGYTFMPRYAKQVSASEMIVPCSYRNFISFAKIQF